MSLQIIGILGGLVSFLSNIPYISDTLKAKTKPHRVTWGIFLLVNVIFLANQRAVGAGNSLWLVIAFTLSTLTIFLLSFKYGVGGHTKLDLIVLFGSILGVLFWLSFSSPLVSILTNLIVATLAVIPTFKKSYIDPGSETKSKWLLGTIGAFLSAVSVGKLDYILLPLPVYSVIMQGSLYLLLVREKVQKRFSDLTPLV